jgi:hypothetical protein
MIRQILLLLMIGFCAACTTSNNKKSALEIENESIKSGIKTDNLGKGYLSGMTKEDVYKHSKEFESKNEVTLLEDSTIITRFETKNFLLTNLTLFYYYNGKLFRKVSHVLTDKNESKNKAVSDFKSEVLDDTKKNFGNEYYANGTLNSKFYWLKGNLRVDYFDTLGTVFVSYSDMLVERQMMAENEKIEKDLALQKQQKKDEATLAAKQEEQKIIEKLKAKAKQDWPNDYTTQEYWIKEQIAAYQYMKTIPDDEIKRKAQQDWPLDFSTQKYWYNEQIEAKERLK